MATPTIRGHQGQFKIFENGQLTNIVDLTSVEVNMDSTMQRTFFVGKNIPEGDQTVEGWSGSLDLEVRNAAIDEFMDALITNNLNGIGISDYTFLTQEFFADGTIKSYVYADVQWKLSKRQSGLNEKMTKRLEFQASFRVAI